MTTFINGQVDGETVREFKDLEESVKKLINASIQARTKAYCPYSKFAVGAALETTNGEIFTGCNVENGAYGSSICAERTAICKAVSEGHLEFKAIAICALQEQYFTFPCGACRQVIAEFAKSDIAVYICKPSPTRVFCSSISKLMPHSFNSKFLETNN